MRAPRRIDPRIALIWEQVLRIPAGRVATYGQIAELCGLPHHARMVARAMRMLPEDSGVPWFRVVAAGGRIAIPHPEGAGLQRQLLEAEGIVFRGGAAARVDLDRCGWRP